MYGACDRGGDSGHNVIDMDKGEDLVERSDGSDSRIVAKCA